ncbi:YkvA family protein [Pseudorhizobium tarimense]|uniref:YkvA family protein n=1 Tax=Pseudorhizobium tarimense TaxID=1079109 RepID=UPI001FF15345|nr:YkvA family protein [Pseudorhizobium tarimense]MCJ8520658.1 YkvA family protein [Pseudorhizobium tarimense]
MWVRTAKVWAGQLKRDVVALWLAARDPWVPRYAKALAGMVAAYALSPIDLIPDFVPILGYLDDLVVVPLGILLAVRLVPPSVMADLRRAADSRQRSQSLTGMLAILAIWIICLIFVGLWFLQRTKAP